MTLEQRLPDSYRSRIHTVDRVTGQGLHSDDEIVLVPQKVGLEPQTYDQVLRDAQDLFCKAAPRSRMLSDELIAERARDAALDD